MEPALSVVSLSQSSVATGATAVESGAAAAAGTGAPPLRAPRRTPRSRGELAFAGYVRCVLFPFHRRRAAARISQGPEIPAKAPRSLFRSVGGDSGTDRCPVLKRNMSLSRPRPFHAQLSARAIHGRRRVAHGRMETFKENSRNHFSVQRWVRL